MVVLSRCLKNIRGFLVFSAFWHLAPSSTSWWCLHTSILVGGACTHQYHTSTITTRHTTPIKPSWPCSIDRQSWIVLALIKAAQQIHALGCVICGQASSLAINHRRAIVAPPIYTTQSTEAHSARSASCIAICPRVDPHPCTCVLRVLDKH